jgi:RNA polymerase sigma-70 factor (ECF subfamily)
MMEEKAGIAPVDSVETDWAVVQRVVGGDIEAFEILLRRYNERVFKLVARRVKKEDVETVAQEVCLAAFRSLHTYEGKQPLENWLARIARRRCCDYWRGQARRIDTASVPLNEDQRIWLEQVSSDLSAEAFRRECERKEATEVVQIALAQLNAEDRTLLESIYFEALSLKEVAVTLEWSVAKVKVRAYRVRKRLQSLIEQMVVEESKK